MSISLQDAVDHLYRLTVIDKRATSTQRLGGLAQYCIEQLEARGVRGALPEHEIPGGGRAKSWDVAWNYDGKFRLAISLKSILKNLSGTIPNRIDDLMGEAANAQLYSPEIVLGYVMLLNVAEDEFSKKHGMKWSELLRSRLTTLSGRSPPGWTIGTIEAHAFAEVDFSQSSSVLPSSSDFGEFFDILAYHVKQRNPNAFLDAPPPP